MHFNKNIILKIKILSTGEILLNNDAASASIDEVKEKLLQLKNVNGVVWYLRENPANIPNEIADEVFRIILDIKLPLSLSSKSDFSDWIDSNGNSHHRQGEEDKPGTFLSDSRNKPQKTG